MGRAHHRRTRETVQICLAAGKVFHKTVTPKSHTSQTMKENIFLNETRGGDKSTHSVQRKRIFEVSNSHTGEFQAEEKKTLVPAE